MVEALEGRALLAASPVDPTFNGGQVLLLAPAVYGGDSTSPPILGGLGVTAADQLVSAFSPTAAQSVVAVLRGTNALLGMDGDYDGDNRSDIAAELTPVGALAYRPSGGGADVVEGFGVAGAGQTIPAPGDYDGDGDGRTDIAAYLPALGALAGCSFSFWWSGGCGRGRRYSVNPGRRPEDRPGSGTA